MSQKKRDAPSVTEQMTFFVYDFGPDWMRFKEHGYLNTVEGRWIVWCHMEDGRMWTGFGPTKWDAYIDLFNRLRCAEKCRTEGAFEPPPIAPE